MNSIHSCWAASPSTHTPDSTQIDISKYSPSGGHPGQSRDDVRPRGSVRVGGGGVVTWYTDKKVIKFFSLFNTKCWGKRETTQNIQRVESRFTCYISCYIAENRLPLGQCMRVNPRAVYYYYYRSHDLSRSSNKMQGICMYTYFSFYAIERLFTFNG